MTRIRKNWTSSRGTEDVDSQPSHAAVANDSHMRDTEGKPQSPLMLQLVDEDAMHMLAAVSLESLEQDSGIRNLKRENASAQVMAAMNAKSLHREPDLQNIKHERASGKVWEQSYIQGSLVSKSSNKSDHWYQKLSALWSSDHGPPSLPKKVSTRRDTVDEEQSKSSSVADNEVVDSDLSARVERAKRGLAGAEPMQGLISGLLQVHCIEQEPGNEETSRVLQGLVFGHSTGRKRRQKPWESESKDLPSTVADGCKTDQKTQNPVSSEVNVASDGSKRRLKIVRASQDQTTCERHKIRAESANAVADNCNGNKDDGNVTQEMPGLKPEKALTDDGDRNQLKAKSEEVGEDVDDRNKLQAKVEKVANAVDERKKQREQSQEAGTDGGDRKRVRVKTQKVESSVQQKSPGEDIFPKGWKYKGLAQIAEKDEATNGQVKKLCGRTDGHNWRCPLRVVEGFSLCQHHLNKARAKKMGKSNQQKKESEKKKSDETIISPHTSDSAASIEPSLPSEHHVPTKLRRRHKTAKLSVL
ncbi:unnamed protein product [Calypogeia fissa]